MSHSVHPYSHRLGILRDWKSRWFGASTGPYQEFLRADVLLREYLEKRLRGYYVNSIEMERSRNTYRVLIKTSRPGMLIGRQGEGATKLKTDIARFLKKINHKAPRDFRLDVGKCASLKLMQPLCLKWLPKP